VLVLLGEAGSGKTHLMRAFRTRAHAQGLGYCGYLQMTTEASNYPRYMLGNLIDGLEQPYAPEGLTRTGLTRLASGLLESVPDLTETAIRAFRDSDCDPTQLVDDYADRLQKTARFHGCDLELIRVMLHLERTEPQVRSRALMWLRCQEMRSQDRHLIGGAVPRCDDADPLRMLIQFAKLTNAVHGVPLVLLIDQLEDMANQSAPVERFRKVVDAITALTDTIPNSVVVLACLEDYFKLNVEQLIKAKHDRLTRDPEPIRLLGNRTLEEIQEMAANRLAFLYDSADVEINPTNKYYPFRETHFLHLAGMRSRDALDYLRAHHQRCIAAGRWLEPPGSALPPPPPPPPPPNSLDPLWNDFRAAFQATVPASEEGLAQVLAGAIHAATPELPDGYHLECQSSDGNAVEVEFHTPDNRVDKLLVAVCNKNPQGGALSKQLDAVAKRLGDFPVALVRTADFPKTGKTTEQVASLLKRDGRRVVVADADLRRMIAFEAFRAEHEKRTDFAAWQKTARPLGELDSMQKILRLNTLVASPRSFAPPAPPPAAPVVAPVRVVAANPTIAAADPGAGHLRAE
jgi:hypothetical protein